MFKCRAVNDACFRKVSISLRKILSSISVNPRSADKTTQNWLVTTSRAFPYFSTALAGYGNAVRQCAFAEDRSYLSPSHPPNPKARGKEGKRGGPSTYLPTRLTSPAPLSSTLDSRLHYIVASGAKFHKRCRFWPSLLAMDTSCNSLFFLYSHKLSMT